MSNLWIEKHRPVKLEDIKGHTDIINTISNYGGVKNIPHLLFYGPPGSGKTSTIMALAKESYGINFRTMVLEMNASDDRGIDIVRNTIQLFVETTGIIMGGEDHTVKLVILDEADAMTLDAQSALRGIMEKYTSTIRFCICCNFVNKIIPSLRSRCTRFRFSGLSSEHLNEKLQDVISKESVNISDSAIGAIISMSDGDTRKVINILQSSHMMKGSDIIKIDDVYRCTGTPLPSHISSILESLVHCTFKESHDLISQIITQYGYSISDIVTGIYQTIPDTCTNILSIMDELADIEYRIAHGASNLINVGSLVSAFHL